MYTLKEIDKLFRGFLFKSHAKELKQYGMLVRFSEHFCDRVYERINNDVDLTNTITMINKALKERLCEIVYALHVPYQNVWLNYKNIRVILSRGVNNKDIMIRTVYKRAKGKQQDTAFTRYEIDFDVPCVNSDIDKQGEAA